MTPIDPSSIRKYLTHSDNHHLEIVDGQIVGKEGAGTGSALRLHQAAIERFKELAQVEPEGLRGAVRPRTIQNLWKRVLNYVGFSKDSTVQGLWKAVHRHEFKKGIDAWARESSPFEERSEAARIMIKAYEEGAIELELMHLNLTSLPPEIGQLVHLQTLDISNNELTSLPAEIGQLVNLEALYSSGNRLTSLPPEIGQLVHLQTLDINDNELTSLPAEIGQLVNLEALYSSGNRLTSLPPEIGQLVKLQELHIFYNMLTSLPPEIGQLVNLRILLSHMNRLTSLPPEIGHLVNLQRLLSYMNRLTSLPSAIGRLVNLLELNIYENELTSLPDTIFDLNAEIRAEQNPFPLPYLDEINERVATANQTPGRNLRIQTSVYEARTTRFTEMTLPQAIDFWKSACPPQTWPSFEILENHDLSDKLRDFLERLKTVKDFENVSEIQKQRFALRVMQVLRAMVENKIYRDIAFVHADEALTRCGDRVTLGLNNLETLWYIHIDSQEKGPLYLAVLGIGLDRLDRIKEVTNRYHVHGGDPVETELFLQINLKGALQLPVKTEGMLYAGVSMASPGDLPGIIQEIKATTSKEDDVVKILIAQDFWQDYLRTHDPEGYTALADLERYPGTEGAKLEALKKAISNRYVEDTRDWFRANREALISEGVILNI